jgi:hypothetical protein
MLVARFFDGLAGSAFLSVAGGTVGDMFVKSELSLPMMVYTASPFIGYVSISFHHSLSTKRRRRKILQFPIGVEDLQEWVRMQTDLCSYPLHARQGNHAIWTQRRWDHETSKSAVLSSLPAPSSSVSLRSPCLNRFSDAPDASLQHFASHKSRIPCTSCTAIETYTWNMLLTDFAAP